MNTSRSRMLISLSSAAVMILVMACGFLKLNLPSEALTATAVPAATEAPTRMPAPTFTPQPTATIEPTKAIAIRKATATTTGDTSDVLVVRPITETQKIETLKAAITLQLDGTDSAGKDVNGDVSMELITNNAQQQRSFVMQGKLLPYMLGNDAKGITRVGVYQMSDATYTLYEGSAQNACEKQATSAQDFEGMTPESLLDIFANDERLYGSLVGTETINDLPTRHYRIDIARTKEAVGKSEDASSLKSYQFMQDGDIYLATEGSYTVVFSANYEGELELFGGNLDGKMSARFDLSELNTGIEVELPEACANATSATDETPEAILDETPEATAMSGEPEPLAFQPITETVVVDSLVSTIVLNFNGTDSNDKPYNGDATIELTKNQTLEQQAIIMKGTLLAALLQQPRLESMHLILVGMYDVSGDIYLHLQGKTDTTHYCAKTTDPASADAFTALSPEGVMASFAHSEIMYGTYAGDETIHGIDTKHYALDPAATNAAALKSTDMNVRITARNQKLISGDVYVAVDGDYVVSLQAQYQGTMSQFGFSGTMHIGFELAELNSGIEFTLPAACANSTSQ